AAKLSTRVEVFTLQPNLERWLQRALVIDCEPPHGIGHPTACAATPRNTPTPALKGSSRLRRECAAKPANSACVRSSLNRRRASAFADGNAFSAKRVSNQGCRGGK